MMAGTRTVSASSSAQKRRAGFPKKRYLRPDANRCRPGRASLKTRSPSSALMEVAAGFAEHVDVQAGRVIDEIDKLGRAFAK